MSGLKGEVNPPEVIRPNPFPKASILLKVIIRLRVSRLCVQSKTFSQNYESSTLRSYGGPSRNKMASERNRNHEYKRGVNSELGFAFSFTVKMGFDFSGPGFGNEKVNRN